MQAILALGANLGDPKTQLLSAIDAIDSLAEISVTDRGPIVESYALTEAGVDESAPRYLNTVIAVDTSLAPANLLAATRKIEADAGRVRDVRWGPRTLDIDIITYEDVAMNTDELTIPHPRAHERAFVIVPWSSMQPNAVLPPYGDVADLARNFGDEVWEAE